MCTFQNYCCLTMDDESVASGAGSEGDLSIMNSLELPDNAQHNIEAIHCILDGFIDTRVMDSHAIF